MYLFTKKKQRGKKTSKSHKNKKTAKGKGHDKRSKAKKAITLNLGSITFHMDDCGNWQTGDYGSEDVGEEQEIKDVEAQNIILAAQNRLQRLKNEVLSHTISRKRMELVQMGEELEKFRNLLSQSPLRFRETDKEDEPLRK